MSRLGALYLSLAGVAGLWCGCATPGPAAAELVAAAPAALAACPASSNCVGSGAADPGHRVEPLPLRGDAGQSLARLRQLLLAMPHTRVTLAGPGYLRAEVSSWVWGFVDDVELLYDQGRGVIQVRSAARTGSYDFGVNRRRIEALREDYGRR